jgi:hypothetical protein
MTAVTGRFLVAALGALLLTNCGGGGSVPTTRSSTAQIWIQPRPYGSGPGIPAGGSTDFSSLFTGTTSWPSVAAHTAVFGFYAGWTADIDDATLATAIGFLSAQHIPIELEAPSLQATASCGSGVEGYVPYGQTITAFTNQYLTRLKALNADVRYIKVDEPFFFGSFDQSDPRACQWPVSQVASEVAQFTALVHATYPNAEVGDVEPLVLGGYSTDVVSALSSWHDAYKTANGAQFPFFVADMDFSNTGWPTLAVQMQAAIRARGETFGIIFIGDPTDTSDAQWSGKTLARAELFAGTSGSAPDFVFFQSWNPYPEYCLPETSSTTLTGVVKAYMDSR